MARIIDLIIFELRLSRVIVFFFRLFNTESVSNKFLCFVNKYRLISGFANISFLGAEN
jgi:hypothetical protein